MSRRSSPAGLGVSTVLTVLLVLCLATFAALTLASAGADLRLSRAAAARTQEYYDADAAAAKLYAGFCAGSDPAFAADLPVGDTRTLHVAFSRDAQGRPVIDCWRVTVPDAVPDTSLPVYTGETGGIIPHD